VTKNQKIRRVIELRNEGLSFREIEARLQRTLGLAKAGNGTKAFRLVARAA
jgi:hypothetical protein